MDIPEIFLLHAKGTKERISEMFKNVELSVSSYDTAWVAMASVLALKRWNMGEDHVNEGLHFIRTNFSSATGDKQQSPIGFDILFPFLDSSTVWHFQSLWKQF
ncbi:hypothetical protein IFM89_038446 [Coptis chinensis]|uniref:Uncharacterized protein n=1 Tax=Coptis chinensis TaxID=261450 RepID=A0A835LXS3_9MAGN|nr:hypothetical protein IFM89_038446 [Coptis chinensis]